MSDQPPPAAPTPGEPDPSGPPPAGDPTAPSPSGQPPDASPDWGPPPGAPPQGWVFPPTGGYPIGAGPYGGQPWYPGPPTGWYPPGMDPADRLVTPPGGGLNGWFDRCLGAVRRGWRLLLPILLLTQVLPAAVLSVFALGLDPSAKWETTAVDGTTSLPDTFFTDLATMFLVLIGGSLLVGFVQAVGWAAGTWVITRQAAGEPVGLGEALRYGLRRALGLWGWTLLMGVIIGLGICFCLLPGIYLAFALSMAGPVYLFERQNPIGRSFRMFHDRLGLLLGRVALVAAVVIVGTLVPGVLEGVGSAPFGVDPLATPGSAVGVVLVIALSAVLVLPAHLAQLVGLLVTYAEQRAHEGPVNSAGLAAELG
ncbi:hypothetical protein DKT68_24550 [Micromonospora acroterricola]|uniref:Glycerophosphoryl diester phosphodiesterase membrane domain-containing protein n=1 Tax=Micromonospora acroterricola TaxID=2202421 RepID=A0A317CTK2_9ACTN|nr:hypothetical protein [Micromonospora acroterricola]PWR05891.1 hypothetical protein DKT68_24550 [Micromonospora acroterricola]